MHAVLFQIDKRVFNALIYLLDICVYFSMWLTFPYMWNFTLFVPLLFLYISVL